MRPGGRRRAEERGVGILAGVGTQRREGRERRCSVLLLHSLGESGEFGHQFVDALLRQVDPVVPEPRQHLLDLLRRHGGVLHVPDLQKRVPDLVLQRLTGGPPPTAHYNAESGGRSGVAPPA